MELAKYKDVVLIGFLVWLCIAPRASSPRYRELFLAYMATLMFCLIGTTEIILIKPVAFFFTVGGVFAFIYVVVRSTFRVSIRK